MKQEAFESKYSSDWDWFENWLDRKEGIFETKAWEKKTKDIRAHEFPHVYRQICQHLALANARQYSQRLVTRLNRLALRGHKFLYKTRPLNLQGMVNFFAYEFPNAFRASWRYQLASGCLFFLPLIVLVIAIQVSPSLVYSVMDFWSVNELETMYDPTGDHFGRERGSSSDFAMFGFYIFNNVTIAFRTFAGGIFGGIGTLFFLVYNGVYIGAAAGHLTAINYGQSFWSFVIGHGAFELTAIFICGGAGLMIGYSLWAPKRRRRIDALQHAAMQALPLIFGSAAMLLIAAFLEAYWSSTNWVGFSSKFIVGSILWFLVILYFALVGKRRGS